MHHRLLALPPAVALVVALSVATTLARAQQSPPRAGLAPEAMAGAASGPAPGATYVVDPTHTFVNYEIGHYGTTTNRGRFSTQNGLIRLDGAGDGRVEITLDISSINTGVDLLNRHLQSKDFFNVAEYPTGRFVADRVTLAGEKISEVPGTLTLLGKTVPVTLKAVRFNCYLSPIFSRQVCGGDFETTITRSDYGIVWGLNFGFEDKVRLIVQIEAIRMQ